MLELNNDVTERLYLCRDTCGDISVPCSNLMQHQIDGIRFLYSQYKKERSGVILNYPPSCGNSVQVAIFISAIREKLKKPVLILYENDQDKALWLERFSKWTDISEDSIEVDTANTFLRKQIFINNIADVAKFYRRSWSIVVVKSDSFNKVFQKCLLEVDYKIWITAQDFKKDAQLLRLVYAWMNPSDQLMQKYFDDKSPALFEGPITKNILLDLLLEDVLFSRKNLQPFESNKRKLEPGVQSPPKVTKKNKDATGTKIKRSKKYQEPPSTSTINIESGPSIPCNDNNRDLSQVYHNNSHGDNVTIDNFTINADRTKTDDEESKMDVESFIRDNVPLRSDISLNFAISNLNSTSQLSEPGSPKAEVCIESDHNIISPVADIIRLKNDTSVTQCEDSVSVDVEIVKENNCDSSPNVPVVESIAPNRIDLSEGDIQKVLYVSGEEKRSTSEIELDQTSDQVRYEAKIEEKSTEGEMNEVVDQKSKLEVSTSVMEETDNSFESKMKELEERALRKFKGSLLDSIFKC